MQIHQLRTLLSGRLIEPIIPIINPKVASRRPLPKSPRVLFEQLSQTARASVAEVQEFQTMWRSPEMKAIWDHVDARIKQNGGQLLQPTGMWEQDYDVLLEELEKEEQAQKEQQQRAKEEEERAKIQGVEGGWRTIVETFTRRNLPGIRVMAHQDQPRITVVSVKAGMAFQLQAVNGDGHDMVDWRVQELAAPGRPKTKLETAVAACLNARPRQWDLAYLLVSSNIDINNRYNGTRLTLNSGHDSLLLRRQTDAVREMRQNDRQRRATALRPQAQPPPIVPRPTSPLGSIPPHLHRSSPVLSPYLQLIMHPMHNIMPAGYSTPLQSQYRRGMTWALLLLLFSSTSSSQYSTPHHVP